LNNDDIRTFGVCIGIKTRKKSEVFSSILIRRKSLLRIFGVDLFPVYDVLCAHDFNPNERTGFVFSRNNPRFLLVEQLRRSVVAFYNYRNAVKKQSEKLSSARKDMQAKPVIEYVHQCKHCFTVYDPVAGEQASGVLPGTLFENLPGDYCCPLCEAPKEAFSKTEKSKLGLQAV
jgi:rubredoxin